MNPVAIGEVGGPHGVRGAFKLIAFSRDTERYRDLRTVYIRQRDASERRRVLEVKFLSGGRPILLVEGIEDRTAAQSIRGAVVEVDAEEELHLDEGEYFVRDIVGLTVKDRRGRVLGRVTDVLECPANDVYVVAAAEKEILIPAVEDFVLEIDLAQGIMLVDSEGLI